MYYVVTDYGTFYQIEGRFLTLDRAMTLAKRIWNCDKDRYGVLRFVSKFPLKVCSPNKEIIINSRVLRHGTR